LITLKQALKTSLADLDELKKDLREKIKQNKHLGAYVEQFTNSDILESGSGIPIAIKDNINVKSWEMTSASKILQGYISPYNATVIEKLLNSGCSAFGRTNMDEFAMGSSTESSCYGQTLNPIDNTKIPGGSSGGSAAAVASGLAIAALGSDTGGSIRQPAAYCGCVGMKPSYGRVSRFGLSAYSSSLDQIGPLTKNVEDAAILYDIISGYDKKDSTSADITYEKVSPKINENKKMTVAVINGFIDKASADVKKAFNHTIDLLKADGHKIIYKDMLDTSKILSSYYIIATAEASANLSRYDGIRFGKREGQGHLQDIYKKSRSLGFGDEVKQRIMLGTFVLSSGYYDAYYIKAQKVRAFIKKAFLDIFKDADLILSPVAPSTAPKLGSYKSALDMYLSDIYTIGVNLAGLPALSLPVAKDNDGMPIGLQFIAKNFDELTLFQGAKNLEDILKKD